MQGSGHGRGGRHDLDHSPGDHSPGDHRHPEGRGCGGHHGHGDHGHGDHGHGRHGGGRGRGRPFDYGELRLLVLALLAENPAHGYELIKAIEERFGGSYSPSPGVIYPTLSWLDDMGYVEVAEGGGRRKHYHVTAEGQAFLQANREAADALLARTVAHGGRHNAPAPVLRAMENLKTALRLRLREGPVGDEEIERIAAAIDAAAKEVERTR
jgi:DNA-binding PadR family transcriptional regulator